MRTVAEGARRVLLLGGHPRLLRKAAECGLEVVNIRKSAFHAPSMAEIHVLDYQNVPAVTALAERLHRDRPFDRVVTQTEAAQLVAGYLTTRLGLPGNGAGVTRTLHDKRLLRALLNERGLGLVAVATGSSREDLVDFVSRHGAAVAKPPMASGSIGVRKITSMAQVDAAWAWLSTMDIDEFMLEELLVGPEVSVETISVANRHVVVAVTGKDACDDVVELGHVVPAPIADDDAARAADLTVRMLDAVRLVEWAAHTEIILTVDGPRVVEAHSRRGGDHITELVDLVYGVDLERLAFQVLVEPIRIEPALPPRGAAAIRFLTAQAGQVTGIEGVDAASAAPRVLETKVWANVGDEVGSLLWSEDRCGYVLTHAPDAARASAAAHAAAAAITIHTVPVPQPVRTTMGSLLARAGEVLDPFAAGLDAAGGRPRLLVVDAGLGPRPTWYLPRLGDAYDVRVVWLATGWDFRDRERSATLKAALPDGAHIAVPDLRYLRGSIVAAASAWLPHGIATLCGDRVVVDVHAACHELGLPANDPASLPALYDKWAQRTMLRAAGLPVPEFAAVDSHETLIAALKQIEGPAILKPVAGSGSIATFDIDAGTDAAQAWARALAAYPADATDSGTSRFILEERLVGRRHHADARYGCQVSVESVVSFGDVVHLAVTDKLPLVPNFREVADITPTVLPDSVRDELLAATTAALRALGITNSATHTEFMLTADGPRLIEVNSRIGGGVAQLLHYAYDYDVMGAVAAVATGRAVPRPGPSRRFAAFLTPQASLGAGRLVAAPSADDLRRLPGVREAAVVLKVGDSPETTAGTKGGMLGHLLAVADEPGALLDLAELLASDRYFRFESTDAVRRRVG